MGGNRVHTPPAKKENIDPLILWTQDMSKALWVSLGAFGGALLGFWLQHKMLERHRSVPDHGNDKKRQ